MHVRTRPLSSSSARGLRNRPLSRPGSHAQPHPTASESPDQGSKHWTCSGSVPHRCQTGGRRTVIHRTDVRDRSADPASIGEGKFLRTSDESLTGGRLIAAVRWYQRVAAGRPSPCRFFPTCSSYAVEALQLHGGRRGLWLTVRRLLRCRPFGPSGFDPVPEPAAWSTTTSTSRFDPATSDFLSGRHSEAPARKGA